MKAPEEEVGPTGFDVVDFDGVVDGEADGVVDDVVGVVDGEADGVVDDVVDDEADGVAIIAATVK